MKLNILRKQSLEKLRVAKQTIRELRKSHSINGLGFLEEERDYLRRICSALAQYKEAIKQNKRLKRQIEQDEELRKKLDVAIELHSNDETCKCDPSVGEQCEMCFIWEVLIKCRKRIYGDQAEPQASPKVHPIVASSQAPTRKLKRAKDSLSASD